MVRRGRPWRLALVLAACLPVAACAGTAASTNSGGSTGSGSNLGTITPGTITVAIEPYMPYTAEQNGKLIGLDS